MEWAPLLLWLLAACLITLGLAGMVLPLLPGAPLLFLGLLAAAWADHFTYVGTGTLVILAVLAALTYLIDFLAGILGAKKFGASSRTMAGAAIGALVGLPLGFAGIVLGPFFGAVVGELSAQRSLRQAGLAGLGTAIGLAVGAAAKLAIGFSMIGIFVLVRFLGS